MEKDRKNRQSNSVLIDYNALFGELEKRNISKKAASEQMGYSDHYLSNIVWDARRRGCPEGAAVIPNVCANLLFELFNIRLEAIRWVEPKPIHHTPQTGDTFLLDENTLYRVIYAAVYAAVKQAWSE